MKGFPTLGLEADEPLRHFDAVQEFLPAKPRSYFDFPASATAFCLSLQNSKPYITGRCLYRERGNHLKLIAFQGKEFPMLEVERMPLYKGIKSLSFSGYPRPKESVTAHPEYYSLLPYNFEEAIAHHSRGNRGRLRRDYRQAAERYTVGEGATEAELNELMETWLRDAKPRKFMVRKGHHLAYIRLYVQGIGGIRMVSFRRKTDGKLHGVIGYETVGKTAQMTLGKHLLGDNAFSTFYYVRTLELLEGRHVKKVFCGSSNDEFKKRIGLTTTPSWKPELGR